MTQSELFTLLKSVGYPVTYHDFKSSNKPVPTPPYIVYLYKKSDNFGADNHIYFKTGAYLIELYTKNKDLQAEQALETRLDEACIFYDKEETYIEDLELFQISYEINI